MVMKIQYIKISGGKNGCLDRKLDTKRIKLKATVLSISQKVIMTK